MIQLKDVILNDEQFAEMQEITSNMQDRLIKEAMIDFEKKRIAIINERLSSLGVDICVEDQRRKRFKDFISERNGNETTIWYRDGSETGLRVVTFVDPELVDCPAFNKTGDMAHKFEVTQKYKYY